ncbi:Glutamine-rich protein 2, partial [Charadrius vociferus]
SGHGVGTVEAVRQVGQLGHLKKEQVAPQEAFKSDHVEREEPHLLFPEGDEESITIQGRMSSLQSLATDLQEVKEKVSRQQSPRGLWGCRGRSVLQEIKQEVMELKALGLEEMKREVLELKELGEHRDMTEATLKRLVTEVAEQMQVQSPFLLPFLQQDKLRETESVGQEQAAAQAACSTCSGDTGVQVGKLLQRYEKLRETVDSLMSRQAVGKVPRQMPRRSQQDEEVLKRIQATLMQVQGDHEKLSSVVGNLLHNSHQQQKD